MFLAIVIPCLNEEKTIEKVIQRIPDNILGISQKKVIVVDDGSTDDTATLAEKSGAIVVKHKKNLGVGSAFKSGIKTALSIGADVVVNMDGDGQFDPETIKLLVEPIVEHKADFVTASRFIDKSLHPKMTKIKFWGNMVMARFISRLIGQKFYDVSCGFRAYSKDVLLRINLFGSFTYTQETFIDLAFKNSAILEVPVKVRGIREFGKSRVASNLFKYAFRTLRIILSTYRDYKPFKLFGYTGFFLMFLGLAFAIFLGMHYLNTGLFTPHKWAGFVSAFLLIIGLISFILGFVLEMFSRMRMNQEEILYLLKRNG